MRIGQVMTLGVEGIGPDATIQEAAEKMRTLDVGPLPVLEEGRAIGMITDRDITVRLTAEGRDPLTARVRDAMTPAVISCNEDDDVTEAARLMEQHQVRRLLVLGRDQHPVGIISLGDIAITTGDDRLTGEALERISEPAKPDLELLSVGHPERRPPGDRSDDSSDQPGRRIVAGLFADRSHAEHAIADLRAAGVDPSRVSVITKDPAYAREVASDTGAKVAGSTAAGAGLGALLGGAAGWLVGIGALAIPGIGPVIAAGPIAAALGVAGTTAAVGAAGGAIAGGLVGALTGWGFSESEAREYEDRVKAGDILITVEADGQIARRAEDLLRQDGADRVAGRRAA
jgi:CBS domain-containing protein